MNITQDYILITLILTVLITIITSFLFFKQKIKKILLTSMNKFNLVIATIIFSLGLGIFITNSLNNPEYVEFDYNSSGLLLELKLEKDIEKLKNQIKLLEIESDSLALRIPIPVDTNGVKNQNFDLIQEVMAQQIDLFGLRIDKLEISTTALRQSINPINPDEILTIARLKDEILELKNTVLMLDENLLIRQQNFEESIKREISSSNNSTTLILVVLIPLVFNFLYSVWKDFKKDNNNTVNND